MPAYLLSYSTAAEQVKSDLEEFMDALGAVPIGDCLYGLEMDLEIEAVRQWLRDQLRSKDALIVIELRPHLRQSNENISRDAAVWLEKMLG